MAMRFLRGDPNAPKGHVIFIARSTSNPRVVFCTYCIVPPTPLSLTKYLPSFLAAQLPPEELREAANVNVMPIPPMLEEGSSLEHLQMLADRRSDDLCDIGPINPRDEAARMQLVAEGCQEYGQLYLNYTQTFDRISSSPLPELDEATPLDDLDPMDLLEQTMTDRERLTELGKLVGMARYALEGRDTELLQDTKRKMQRISTRLPDKYRANDLTNAALEPGERGAKLVQLYLDRGFKLLDEEYADIPSIERAIRDLQP